MREKVLIDLTKIGNPFCGFGSIALAYEELFAAYEGDEFEFLFLVPENYVGRFPDKVTYVKATKKNRRFSSLLPEVKIWHSTTQQFKHLRLGPDTRQILTIHDLNFLYEKQWYRIIKHLYQMWKATRRASALTVISQYVKQEVQKNIPLKGKEIRVIYNGVARIDDQPDQQPVFIKDNRRPFFFTIGQIRRKKNFHVLLEMMKFFPEHDLYICGDDHWKYADQMRETIRKENLVNVQITGAITFPEKIWLYRRCDAFLFPSTLEGFGIPVLEAMQFGKAVFSSRCSSLPEICGPHAFFFDNFAAESMARLVREQLPLFYESPQRIEAARRYALSFTYERHIAEYMRLYRELLEHR